MNLWKNGPSEQRTFETSDLRYKGPLEKRAVPGMSDLVAYHCQYLAMQYYRARPIPVMVAGNLATR